MTASLPRAKEYFHIKLVCHLLTCHLQAISKKCDYLYRKTGRITRITVCEYLLKMSLQLLLLINFS